MSRAVPYLLALAAAALSACGPTADRSSDSVAATPATNGPAYAYERLPLDTTRKPGAVIDSVFPMPEMIRRFRDGLPVTDRLVDGATSREALVEAFTQALARRDTPALGRLTLSRAEFAYLYMPTAPEITSANGLPPQRLWDQLTLASEKGIGRTLDRVGGRPLTLQALTCPGSPTTTGAVRVHLGCTVRLGTTGGATAFDGHLFGAIIELAGRFKFNGYANDM